jgi:hypothetical protein
MATLILGAIENEQLFAAINLIRHVNENRGRNFQDFSAPLKKSFFLLLFLQLITIYFSNNLPVSRRMGNMV